MHLVGVELDLEQLAQGLNVSRGRLAAVAGGGASLNSRKFTKRSDQNNVFGGLPVFGDLLEPFGFLYF